MEHPTLDKFPRRVLAAIDMQTAFIASRLVVAAERLQVFRLLHGKGMAAAEVGKKLNIHAAYLLPFLDALTGLGLLRATGESYGNTELADKYFVAERSIYWTRHYSKECVEKYEALTVLERALATGKRYEEITGRKKLHYVERMKRNPREAEEFTQMLFHYHRETAEEVAGCVDLSARRAVLDVGGGSGVMSIALARKSPHLRACVLDIAPVCKVAARNARKAGVAGRVSTRAGDIRQPLPPGFDVIMFCDIGPVSAELLENAYQSLPSGGMVVLADRYLSDGGTRPLDRLLGYFVGGGFGLQTGREMVEAVRECGFKKVKARRCRDDLWVITGRKARNHKVPRLAAKAAARSG